MRAERGFRTSHGSDRFRTIFLRADAGAGTARLCGACGTPLRPSRHRAGQREAAARRRRDADDRTATQALSAPPRRQRTPRARRPPGCERHRERCCTDCCSGACAMMRTAIGFALLLAVVLLPEAAFAAAPA